MSENEAKLACQAASLTEAWTIIYAMEGQESWGRAIVWLREHIEYKPACINADWLK